jgi:hypothetical protein
MLHLCCSLCQIARVKSIQKQNTCSHLFFRCFADYTRTTQVYESAYMLIYSKAVPGERLRARVPAALAAEIAVANQELVVSLKLQAKLLRRAIKLV